MARRQPERTVRVTPTVSFEDYQDIGFQQAAARANTPTTTAISSPTSIGTNRAEFMAGERATTPAQSVENLVAFNKAVEQAAYRAGERDTATVRSVENVPVVQDEQTTYRAGERGDNPPPGPGTSAVSAPVGPAVNPPVEPPAGLTTGQQNALTIINGWMKEWGIEGLSDVVKNWIGQDKSEDAALFELRGTDAYAKRFPGMKLRADSNLAPINEATYLALEDDYDAWARYYGVEGSFGATTEERRTKFGNLIGKNVNTTTFRDYVDTVVTRVNKADPSIKKTLNDFYGITDTDLKNYYINPTENVKALQEKVTAAEIGAAAASQALMASKQRSEELARFGIDRELALTGYERIANALPEGRKLSGIYREEGIDYTQETAEEEEFKGMESAARKRRRLAGLSEASFQQSGALTQSSLGARGVAGQI